MDLRCLKCNRWLLKVIEDGTISIRVNCCNCKTRWLVHVSPAKVRLEISTPAGTTVAGNAPADGPEKLNENT